MFKDLKLSPELLEVVQELGYSEPTPIQAQSIPLILKGKDLIGQAQTGSGKTAAFGLPLLQGLRIEQGKYAGQRLVQALILCPTRELCTQVAREIRKLGRKHAGLQVLIVSGGLPMGPQMSALEHGVHVVVGTPGRVLDHLNRDSLNLSDVRILVLDEADRMLEMGFKVDLEKIISQTPHKRQTVLFSATFPKTIEGLSKKYQDHPVRVTVKAEEKNVPVIRQVMFEVPVEDRIKALLWAMEQNKIHAAIVFCNYKASVIELTQKLEEAGMSVGALHGDLEQSDRDRMMAKFRNKSIRLLVATDVAARGIDIPNLDAVFNFEMPAQPEIYVHRIGRTGRAGQSGLAISFYLAREKFKLEQIEKLTQTTLQKKTAPALESLDVERMRTRLPSEAEMKTLFISGGRKQKVRAGDILGALTGEAGGMKATDIGKIEIHDNFSYVAVTAKLAPSAIDRLRLGKIKGRKFRIEAVR